MSWNVSKLQVTYVSREKPCPKVCNCSLGHHYPRLVEALINFWVTKMGSTSFH